ncbi:hypothetical protein ACIBW9_34130 [Streptomyces sp. NPDC049541]|uniref:hypothetical protein n=1 Tax=Streptomyces sp. NPDC049541 TaxID=3365594 RepID=UPI003799C675
MNAPVDATLAEVALAVMYDHLGLARPRVVWMDSPGAARAPREAGVEAEGRCKPPNGLL